MPYEIGCSASSLGSRKGSEESMLIKLGLFVKADGVLMRLGMTGLAEECPNIGLTRDVIEWRRR